MEDAPVREGRSREPGQSIRVMFITQRLPRRIGSGFARILRAAVAAVALLALMSASRSVMAWGPSDLPQENALHGFVRSMDALSRVVGLEQGAKGAPMPPLDLQRNLLTKYARRFRGPLRRELEEWISAIGEEVSRHRAGTYRTLGPILETVRLLRIDASGVDPFMRTAPEREIKDLRQAVWAKLEFSPLISGSEEDLTSVEELLALGAWRLDPIHVDTSAGRREVSIWCRLDVPPGPRAHHDAVVKEALGRYSGRFNGKRTLVVHLVPAVDRWEIDGLRWTRFGGAPH